jgi:crotonobetaine/carnitine-CoA ligase
MMSFDYLSGPDASVQAVFAAHAAEVPDKTFAEMGGRSYSYGQIDADANRFAHALAGQLGARPGDIVAVYMSNCPEFFPVMLGLQRAGAVYVPFSTHYSVDELTYQLAHCEARIVIVDTGHHALLSSVLPACPQLEHVLVVGGDCEAPARLAQHSLATLSEAGEATIPSGAHDVCPDDLAMIMYTSGTTSRPKGVMFSAGNLYAAADMCVTHFRWNPADRFLHFFPLFHSNGGLFGVWPAVLSQATIVMVDRFSASNFGRQLHELDISLASVNATHAKMTLAQPPTEHDRAHRAWRMCLGLTLEPGDVLAFEHRFGTRLCPTYGLTESMGNNVIGDPIGPRRIGSAGRIVRGYSIRVADSDGSEAGAGQAGQAQIFSHQRHGLPLGYFRNPEATAATYADGGVQTGDVVRVDADGYVWFVERQSDMIKRSGFNVAPAEIERVVRAIDGVTDVAVVPTADAVREQAIVVYVVAAEGASLDVAAVLSACSDQLAEYKVPQVVEFIAELPRTFLGKIDRKALRQRALVHAVPAGTAQPRPDGRRQTPTRG